MLTIRNIFFAAVLLSLGFFVGCGGGDNPSSSGTGDGGDNSSAEALRIAYSDWPGWVAWEIGIQKGFFKDAGVNVEFTWLDYVPSMDSFATQRRCRGRDFHGHYRFHLHADYATFDDVSHNGAGAKIWGVSLPM